MRGDEQLPLPPRATLRDHAPHRVAGAASRLGARVGGVAILDHPPLDLEAPWPQLAGCEALIVAQVSHDRPRVSRIELHVVQRDHAAHRHLPAFGSFPLVRDPLHDARGVAHVTARTMRARRRVANDETGRRIGGRRARNTAGAAASSTAAARALRLADARASQAK